MSKDIIAEPTYCRCGRKYPDPQRGICGVCIGERNRCKVKRPKSQRQTGRDAVTVRLPEPMSATEKYHGRLMAG